MSVAQFVFFCGFALVAVAIVAFSVVVVRSARRDDGGPFVSRSLVARLARPGRDRAELQRWAFYLHRVSGLGLFAFLCLHVGDVSLYVISREIYDEVHQVYGSVPMRFAEVGLLFGLLFHTANGLRLVAVDLVDLGLTGSTRALYGVLGVSVVGTLAGAVFILGPVIV
ncbi:MULTISPECIES: succinate dehydrogenase, cytochrome b556 subunit [Prauserella salsuginis group]|uniref:Succinate dehydrogenase / fumarate reductase cytochrome b subunit n=2 Tax=Prauserella salsuginis group TaxID=2893672 RepID=A0A839XUH6_9PSEU|nr:MULTISPECIES: succinate dehydrogenase, cytochrome b556 subunit [Prauserella salsuginis group]MBB3664213.1 succinate dehydrogenase / fumarate reductase cytochrome b subunit [Prauserella sediminis]MCR3721662.1 succinate dehydrogenase subunit C (EC 1.3.5.1) [Prauserella flava]MCR3734354.1 succinate dehydrogenase subunit C (EC 1.3.5.1) [Prauserella salsuginis]